MIRYCLQHPRVPWLILFILLLGCLLGIRDIPLQLLPIADKPVLTLECFWPHASPKELEAEVVKPLEDALLTLPALSRLNAVVNQGDVRIQLLLDKGADRREAILELFSRINRVQGLPDKLEGPYIRSGIDNDCLTWLMLHGPDSEKILLSRQYEFTRLLQERIGRLPGVSRLVVHGGGDERLEVRYDPFRLAATGLTVPEVACKIRGAANRSAGLIDMAGRFEYPLRYLGRPDVDSLAQLQLTAGPVKLGDIAGIQVAHERGQPCPRYNGKPAFAVEVIRQPDSNVMQTLALVSQAVDDLNQNHFADSEWQLDQPFNMGVYLQRVLSMLAGNLGLGIGLTLFIVCLFIRQWRAALLIILVIPVCLILTLGAMRVLGFTLNVISIAGLAFAVGMVVDAAIVVTENLMARVSQGEQIRSASINAAESVSRALIAATLTTLIVFIPGAALPGTAGQLFSELGITLVMAVALSLPVALFLVPLMAPILLNKHVDGGGSQFISLCANLCGNVVSSPARCKAILLLMLLLPLGLLWKNPAVDLLPFISRDEVQVWLNFKGHLSPGIIEQERVAPILEHMERLKSENQLRDSVLQLWPGGGKLVARPQSPAGTQLLLRKLRRFFSGMAEVDALVLKTPLFAPLRSEQEIQLYLVEADLSLHAQQAETAISIIVRSLPDAQVRTEPGDDNLRQGLHIIPRDRALLDAGWERQEMAEVIQSVGQGLYIGDWYHGDRLLELVLIRSDETHAIESTLVAVKDKVVPLSGLVESRWLDAPDEIRRHEGRRVQMLTIEPPEGMALSSVADLLKNDVLPELKKQGITASLDGSVLQLEQGRQGLWLLLIAALLILAVVLWVSLESWADTFRVLLVMPVCMAGAWFCVDVLMDAGSVDLLTLTGFVILMGLVVNNAILLLSEIRSQESAGLSKEQAVTAALKQRLRPMLMTTLTTVMGMLPLVLSHAEGSDIYRGLAIVVAGGMLVSLPASLLLMPALIRLGKGNVSEHNIRKKEQGL